MAKIERRFLAMALERGITVSDAEMQNGIANFVGFLRDIQKLKEQHDKNMRDFGADKFRQTRQRILAACAGITPERICRAAANDGRA